MNNNLLARLWELAYGLLDEDEAAELRERITSDRAVAREYARVKLQIELVASAARASAEAGSWDTPPTPLVSSTVDQRQRWGRRAVSALSTCLALMLLAVGGAAYWAETSLSSGQGGWKETAAAHPRMIVTGPSVLDRSELHFAPQYEVLLQSVDQQPLPMPLEAMLQNTKGDVVWNERREADSNGLARFSFPMEQLDHEALQLTVKALAGGSGSEQPAAELRTWLPVIDTPPRRLYMENETIDRSAGISFFKAAPVEMLARDKFDDAAEKESRALSEGVRYRLLPIPSAPPEALAATDAPLAGRLESALPSVIRSESAPAGQPEKAESRDALVPKLAKKLSEDSREPQEELAMRRKWVAPLSAADRETPPLLIEALTENGRLRRSRILSRAEAENFEFGRSLRSADEALSRLGDGERLVYDFTTAPPRSVVEETKKIEAEIEPLHIEVSFDQADFAPEEPIVAAFQVKSFSGEPVAAVLGVRIKSVSAEESDQPLDEDSWLRLTYYTHAKAADLSDDASMPLVFDNGRQQLTRLQSAVEEAAAAQTRQRKFMATTLIVGSLSGTGLLFAAALLGWLPRTIAWMPAAGVLVGCLAAGVMLNRPTEMERPQVQMQTLTNYGLRHEPPKPAAAPEPLDRFARSNLAESLERGELDQSRSQLQRTPLALYGLSLNDANDAKNLSHFEQTPLFAFREDRLEKLAARRDEEPRTLLWEPALDTDPQGQATLQLALPPSRLSYWLIVDAQAGQAFGSTTLLLPTQAPVER
jgi:hypothetical protein